MLFREISIPLGDREFVVVPANKILRRIEAKGRRDDPAFSLVQVMIRLSSGNGAMNDGAFVAAELINSTLRETDRKVSDDDVLAYMMAMEKPEDLRAYIDLICSCVMPEPKAKKPEAPAETG